MSTKITLPMLVNLLSAKTGESKKNTEDFVREFFSMVSATLQRGENVKFKDLGVFKLVDVESRKSVDVNSGVENRIPAHKKVIFVPCKELAAAVNAPFEMFDTVELSADIIDIPEMTESSEQTVTTEVSENVEISEPPVIAETPVIAEPPEIAEVSEVVETAERVDETEPEQEIPEAEQEPAEPMQESSEIEQEEATPVAKETLAPVIPEVTKEVRRQRDRFLPGFLTGVACTAVILTLVYFFLIEGQLQRVADVLDNTEEVSDTIPATSSVVETIEADSAAEIQTEPESVASKTEIDEVPTAVSEAVVYDTISHVRYLTTMAKDHYGNYHLWPYIYMANPKLGHPDKIRPGTRVVIPPLSKYGVDPKNKEDIRKATQKGNEIYSRYR